MNWGSRAGVEGLPEPGRPGLLSGVAPPEGESVAGFEGVGLAAGGEGAGTGSGSVAGSPVAGAQSGSPGSQEVVASVGSAEARPGAGGPAGAADAAGIAAHMAKKSSDGRVAQIATDRIRRIDSKPCATWWFPTKTDKPDPLPRCGR